MTSTTIGIDGFEMSKSIENEPSESGDMRRPFTLKVASGDVTPATVIWSNSVIILILGEVSRSMSAWDCGSTWGLSLIHI